MEVIPHTAQRLGAVDEGIAQGDPAPAASCPVGRSVVQCWVGVSSPVAQVAPDPRAVKPRACVISCAQSRDQRFGLVHVLDPIAAPNCQRGTLDSSWNTREARSSHFHSPSRSSCCQKYSSVPAGACRRQGTNTRRAECPVCDRNHPETTTSVIRSHPPRRGGNCMVQGAGGCGGNHLISYLSPPPAG